MGAKAKAIQFIRNLTSLIRLAKNNDAIPIVLLRTKGTELSGNGAVKRVIPQTSHKRRSDVTDLIIQHPGLSIWDESGQKIVSDKDINHELKWRAALLV